VLTLLGSLPDQASLLETAAVSCIGAINGAILVTPIVLRFFASPRAVWERRGVAFLLPLLIAVTLTAVVFRTVVRREDERIRDHFSRTAESTGHLMNQSLVGYVDVLHALTGLFESSDFVTAKEFHTFVNRVLPGYGGIQALEWAPVVRDAARGQFEADLGRPLRSFSADGEGIEAAGPSDVYMPIRYAEPAAPNERLVGLDLASEQTRRWALFSSARTVAPVDRAREAARGQHRCDGGRANQRKVAERPGALSPSRRIHHRGPRCRPLRRGRAQHELESVDRRSGHRR
jgi:hypothetical protein